MFYQKLNESFGFMRRTFVVVPENSLIMQFCSLMEPNLGYFITVTRDCSQTAKAEDQSRQYSNYVNANH